MKTDYRYIRFEEDEPALFDEPSVFHVKNRQSGTMLGTVEWYPDWGRWVFCPAADNLVFNATCLENILHFLHQLRTFRSTGR